jgi:subtilisin family serine protease
VHQGGLQQGKRTPRRRLPGQVGPDPLLGVATLKRKRIVSKRRGFLSRLTTAVIAAFTVALPASAQVATGRDAQGEYARGRVLVMPRAGLPSAEFSKIVGAHGGKARTVGSTGLYIVELPSQASETAVAQQLARNPHLKFAELDRRVYPSLAVNDPYIGAQWHTTKIGAPSAWDISQGSNIVIAILDTGVDSSHPDLSARMVSGWNVSSNNADTSDWHGHGTWTAGTAAATLNNGTGVAGVAGQAKIMPVRIADPGAPVYWSTVAQGITYAADKGARVASISYWGLMASSAIQSASQYMKDRGGLVVVSAGNNGTQENYSATSTMIPVSATDQNDQLTSFSSYGSYVALAAPGVDIWTTSPGGGYAAGWGTSFSTPVTAGAVALIMAAKPGLTSTQVESILFKNATDLGPSGRDVYFGYGRVNADAAVRAAAGTSTPPADTTAPTASIDAPLAGSTVSGVVPVNVSASDNVGVSKVELRVNGALYATDTSSPFAFSWDSTRVANGSANLQAVAYDAAGNTGASSTTTVTVSNSTAVAPSPTIDTTPPVVSLISPSSGFPVSGTVNVSASAVDNVGVVRVEFWINGVLTATDTSEPYSFGWNTRKLSGDQTIVAKAFDAAGNAATSTPMTVTVLQQNNKGGRK